MHSHIFKTGEIRHAHTKTCVRRQTASFGAGAAAACFRGASSMASMSKSLIALRAGLESGSRRDGSERVALKLRKFMRPRAHDGETRHGGKLLGQRGLLGLGRVEVERPCMRSLQLIGTTPAEPRIIAIATKVWMFSS